MTERFRVSVCMIASVNETSPTIAVVKPFVPTIPKTRCSDGRRRSASTSTVRNPPSA
jgi:hypothetical protein